MKKLLVIAALGLILITPSQANIEDFQIEGMSIGESLLDYFSKEQIETAPRYDNTNTNTNTDDGELSDECSGPSQSESESEPNDWLGDDDVDFIHCQNDVLCLSKSCDYEGEAVLILIVKHIL